MLPVNSFNDYSPWADCKKTISRLDRISCLCVEILHKIYLQRYNKHFYQCTSIYVMPIKTMFYFYSVVQPPLYFGRVSTRCYKIRTSIFFLNKSTLMQILYNCNMFKLLISRVIRNLLPIYSIVSIINKGKKTFNFTPIPFFLVLYAGMKVHVPRFAEKLHNPCKQVYCPLQQQLFNSAPPRE